MTSLHFYEDLAVGQTFGSGSYDVTADEIVSFARQYDPQPFHTDAAAAERSAFGRLVASGWHTAAMTMRLLTESDLRPAGGSIGAGADELRWTRPVYPGDSLHLQIEVVEMRRSQSKPDRGIVKLRIQTLNAADELVQDLTINSIVPCRDVRGA